MFSGCHTIKPYCNWCVWEYECCLLLLINLNKHYLKTKRYPFELTEKGCAFTYAVSAMADNNITNSSKCDISIAQTQTHTHTQIHTQTHTHTQTHIHSHTSEPIIHKHDQHDNNSSHSSTQSKMIVGQNKRKRAREDIQHNNTDIIITKSMKTDIVSTPVDARKEHKSSVAANNSGNNTNNNNNNNNTNNNNNNNYNINNNNNNYNINNNNNNNNNNSFHINLTETRYKHDAMPLVSYCPCYACTHHSRAYIHHLLRTHEILASVLLTMYVLIRSYIDYIISHIVRTHTHTYIHTHTHTHTHTHIILNGLLS